jgi:hypothetical protein
MILFAILGMLVQARELPQGHGDQALTLSGDLLMQVRQAQPTTEIEAQLAQLRMSDLQAELDDDTRKKTFWINLYNAYFQILAQGRGMTKPAIFKEKCIAIAGEKFSLDDIEHGILRRYRWKYSLGYLPRLFPGKLLRALCVDAVDYRIHFALNCGAKSCPPIASYEAERLDQQLDIARDGFLQAETQVDAAHKTLAVTALFQWFRADFGGKRGVRRIVGEALGQDFAHYKIVYQPYDWSAQLHHFAE